MKSDAKRSVLKELKKMMREDMYEPMGEKVKDMKKVTVMSDSKEGLEEGLTKAQKILKSRMGEMMDMEEESEDNDDMKEKEDEYACGGVKRHKKKK